MTTLRLRGTERFILACGGMGGGKTGEAGGVYNHFKHSQRKRGMAFQPKEAFREEIDKNIKQIVARNGITIKGVTRFPVINPYSIIKSIEDKKPDFVLLDELHMLDHVAAIGILSYLAQNDITTLVCCLNFDYGGEPFPIYEFVSPRAEVILGPFFDSCRCPKCNTNGETEGKYSQLLVDAEFENLGAIVESVIKPEERELKWLLENSTKDPITEKILLAYAGPRLIRGDVKPLEERGENDFPGFLYQPRSAKCFVRPKYLGDL